MQADPRAAAAPRPAAVSPSRRLDSIDLLRGIAMVLMALDHARDFFEDARVDPTALASTTPLLFATRWVTHFCAPVFVFLAGVSVALWSARGKTRAQTASLLATRGLWLVVLEWTAVQFGWFWSGGFGGGWVLVQVIAAIGVGFLGLSLLVFLPRVAVGAVGLAIVLGHNLLDPVAPADLGSLSFLWSLLHEGGFTPVGSLGSVLVLYPLLPWLGVLALGYAFGPVMLEPPEVRRRKLLLTGGATLLGFLVLRAGNVYGDPTPWAPQDTALMSVISFLNCQKYPPSLLYLAMTLGPALLVLPAFEHARGALSRALVVFGRVPLFYYLAHIFLLHLASDLIYRARGAVPPNLAGAFPDEVGFGLPAVYGAWLACVLILFPACAWYAGVKRRSRSILLTYL